MDARSIAYSRSNEDQNCTSGVGLGISLSMQLAQFYDGQLEIDSEVGSGTTVRIILNFNIG